MTAYYNDSDPYICAWVRNLIEAKMVPYGVVDERSITEVKADDLRGFVQCHFFCGILGWPLALRLAGVPDDLPVWTGSCPCQPFSIAGKRKGTADKRHLWPEFYRLIRECSPAIVFGEQVASKDGRKWLAGVRADLEALGYAVGAADLCAASAGEKRRVQLVDEFTDEIAWEGELLVGAPHIRQRLYWVAQYNSIERKSVFGRRSGLPFFESMEMDNKQQGLSVPEYSARENTDAQAVSRSAERRDSRSQESQQVRQQKAELTNSNGIGKQLQPETFYGRSYEIERSNEVDCLSLDRQKIPMAWIVCDEGGSYFSEDRRIDESRTYYDTNAEYNESVGLADTQGNGWREGRSIRGGSDQGSNADIGTGLMHGCAVGGLADLHGERLEERKEQSSRDELAAIERSGDARWLEHTAGEQMGVSGQSREQRDADSERMGHTTSNDQWRERQCKEGERQQSAAGGSSAWSDFDVVHFSDGKAGRIESGSQPLVAGLPFRLADGRTNQKASRKEVLKGIGNAIVPPLAAEFIKAIM